MLFYLLRVLTIGGYCPGGHTPENLFSCIICHYGIVDAHAHRRMSKSLCTSCIRDRVKYAIEAVLAKRL